MSTDPAQPQAQACDTTAPAPENSEGIFSFTPIKALRSLPRLWERKPSTPFRAGAKSRKLWKRFRSSFGGMNSLESSSVLENDALQTVINTSRDSSYVRGVKRQCVAPSESENHVAVDVQQPGRSFLETKWESDLMRKKRKMPDAPIDIYDDTLQNEPSSTATKLDNDGTRMATITKVDMDGDLAMTMSSQPLSASQSPVKTDIFQGHVRLENSKSPVRDADSVQSQESSPVDQPQRAIIDNATQNENDDKISTTPVVRDLTQEQEGTLVRSALRSSLDGDDTALLNTFLSKAQAKRAAKTAKTNPEDAVTVEKLSSPEVSPETESSTPRSRRALVSVDTNSPSPVKAQVSPSKEGVTPGDEARENDIISDFKEDEAPASPACRRSARVKAPATTGPPARSTIALRRAKGNEFVFLQKTEAQELALATKRNTRQNKGHCVLPRHALEAMALQGADSCTSDSDKQSKSNRKGSSKNRADAPRKHVSWNEEHLAEYEDERQPPEELDDDGCKSDVGSAPAAKRSDKKSTTTQRSSRSQGLQKESSEEAEGGPTALVAPSAATPKSRRVRRLGDSTMISGTPVKTGSGRANKPPTVSAQTEPAAGPSTPTKARRKLVPKSPSTSMLPAPTSKGTTDQSFVSGIPTRRAASSKAASSEGTKRKSMLEASAGCTPMPKRVRSRT